MELSDYRTLGRSGLRVSPMAVGTMAFGDPSWGSDEATSFAIVDRFVDAGGNVIDSANGYTEGRSERIIGQWLRKNPSLRDKIVISTKFARSLSPGDPNAGGSSRKAIIQQLNASLERLQTDCIDLYWQHCLDQHTPIEETISTLNDLVTAGKIRYIGLSNTPGWAVGMMTTMTRLLGLAPIVALQVPYSLLSRSVEGEQFGVARANSLGIFVYGPLASGTLTGKYSRDNTKPEGSGRGRLAADYLNETAFTVMDKVAEIAKVLNTTSTAVALAWVRQRAEVTTTLVGARSVEQLDGNLVSLSVTLPDDAVAELNALTEPDLDYPARWLRTIAVPLTQSGTRINGIGAPTYKRAVGET